MDPEDFQTPVSEDDPLAQVGLVDYRTGRALPTAEWRPSAASTQSSTPTQSSGAGVAGGDTEGEPAGSGVTETPAMGTADASGAPESTRDWESDENPYKARFTQLQQQTATVPDPAAAARQNYASREQQLNSERDTAYALLTTQGLDGTPMAPAVARVVVDSLHRAALADARLQADRAALMPTAKQAVASDIARRHSTNGVNITAEELMTVNTPEAMEAKAQALAEGRRDQRFRARRAAGTDHAESGPASAGAARMLEDMSPTQRIALGLRRGELG